MSPFPSSQYDLRYDDHGRITQVDDVFANTAWNDTHVYNYDDTDQLKSADHNKQGDEAYNYDVNGNRIGDQTHLGLLPKGSQVDQYNRITSDGTYTYAYDDEGNMISKTNASTGALEEYYYDHRNRLIRVGYKTAVGTSSVQDVFYRYDHANRMIRRLFDADGVAGTGGTSNLMYVYDGEQIVQAFTRPGSTTSLTNRFLWGPERDQLLADEQVTSTSLPGTVYWVLEDQLHSVRDLVTYDPATDTTTVAKHRQLDAYGNLISDSAPGISEIFVFTGRFTDPTTGLQYNTNRWYVTRLGVWMSEDPIGFAGDPSNLRRYVGNSPTNYTDPTGLVGDGHHLVNQANWTGMSQAVKDVFDATDARIRNEFYKFHDFSTVNGISHDCYNQEIAKELTTFLNGRDVSKMTPEDAKAFLTHVKNSTNATISGFNRGVKAEAHAAYEIGKAAYDAAGGKTNPRAYQIGVDEAGKAVKLTRKQINDTAAKAAKKTLGKILRGLIPFVGAGTVLCSTGDVNASGREAFLELTGLDTPRDLAELGGVAFEEAQRQIDETADRVRRSERWGGFYD